MNPMLLFCYIEKGLKDEVGVVKIVGRKLKVLRYADDLVVLTEKKENMRLLLKRFERYLDRKKLVFNVEKMKVIRVQRGRGGERKVK